MTKACSHCHLEYNQNLLFKRIINNKEVWFCCKGCEGVYTLLIDSNLDIFYSRIGDNKLSPPKDYADDLARFDSPSFGQKYTKIVDSNLLEVSLIIENIHCVACVWLNEKVLKNTFGIYDVSINYTTNRAKIRYNKDEINLSKIILTIRNIGYDAQIYDPKNYEEINAKEHRSYYIRMLVGIFCTMNIMWIAIAQYLGYFFGIDVEIKNILNIASFLLSTPALFYCGWIFFRGGYYGLINGFITMDLLVSIGSSTTYLYSIYAALSGKETYFESVTMIITFILIGKFLEKKSIKNASDNVDELMKLPSTINVVKNENSIFISPEEVRVGDIIKVLPGEKIIIDGVLISDMALLDSSMISGENELLEIKRDENLISGSINLNYSITYKAIKTFQDSTISNIINIIESSIKPNTENKANSISYYFSAFIFFVSLITFGFWFFINGSLEQAIVVGVSVIIIACPCALALATPIATIRGINEAYKSKILFKESKFLETMAKTNVILFDKTGTLTYGVPKVVSSTILSDFNFDILASFVESSSHPISIGISEYLNTKNKNLHINNFKQIDNKGIIGEYNGKILIGGSRQFLIDNGVDCKINNDNNEYSNFYYAFDYKLKAVFNLEDIVRENAKAIVQSFYKLGFKIAIVSGDKYSVVQKIASKLGINEFYYSKNPIQKGEIVDRLHSSGYRIIMVGDGINDSIAMNKSDIAISMGQGSDVAIHYSDIVLLDNNLQSLLNSYKISIQTYNAIKQNIFISIIYNLLTIPIATLGFIIPLFAALSMSASSLVVVLNSIKIKAQ